METSDEGSKKHRHVCARIHTQGKSKFAVEREAAKPGCSNSSGHIMREIYKVLAELCRLLFGSKKSQNSLTFQAPRNTQDPKPACM